MKKAVFFDIDGTLWDERMEIPASTIEAVRKLRDNGHYAFICSGRSRSNIKSPKLLGIGFDGVVASCGAHIDFHEGKAFEYLMPKEDIEHALTILKKHCMPVILEGPEYLYMDDGAFQDDPFVDFLRAELGENIKAIKGTTDFVINKMSVAIREADIGVVKEELGEGYDFIVHGKEIAEIVPRGYSKATGIQKVCEMFSIPHENTYAFGDSANDLAMLEFVAHGIAMGNGTKEAKLAAEYVTTDIAADGIKNGLEHYRLI